MKLFIRKTYFVTAFFLLPNLYHWIGRPDLSSKRIIEIIKSKFNSSRKGIPGNDDSGAMGSWLAVHMIGLYPNAGQSYYLINSPFVKQTTIKLEGSKSFSIIAKNLSDQDIYIKSARLNNQSYPSSWIEHSNIIKGGILKLEMSDKASDWGTTSLPPSLSTQ